MDFKFLWSQLTARESALSDRLNSSCTAADFDLAHVDTATSLLHEVLVELHNQRTCVD